MPANGGGGRRGGGAGGGRRPHSALEVMRGGAAPMWDPQFRKMDAGSRVWDDEVHRGVSDAFLHRSRSAGTLMQQQKGPGAEMYPKRTQEEADESHSPSAGMLMRGGGARSAVNDARSRRSLALDLEHCVDDVPEQLPRGHLFSLPEVPAKARPYSAHPNKGLPLQNLHTKDARLLCLRPSGTLPDTSTPPSAAVKGPQTPREEGMRAFKVRPASKLRRVALGEGLRRGEGEVAGGGRGADAREREEDEDGEEQDGILGEVWRSSVESPESRADTLAKLFMTQRGTTVANAVPVCSRPVSALIRPGTAAITVGAGGGRGAAEKGGVDSLGFGGRVNAGTSRRAVGCRSGVGGRRGEAKGDWDAGSEGISEKSWDENVEWLLGGNTALKRKTEMRQKAMSGGTEARDHEPDHVRFETSSSNMSQAQLLPAAAGFDLLENKDQRHTLAGGEDALLIMATVEVKRYEVKADELEAAAAAAAAEEEEEEEKPREDVRSSARVGGGRTEETKVHTGGPLDDASGSDNCVTKIRSREMDLQICSPISGCTGETFTYTSGEESD